MYSRKMVLVVLVVWTSRTLKKGNSAFLSFGVWALSLMLL